MPQFCLPLQQIFERSGLKNLRTSSRYSVCVIAVHYGCGTAILQGLGDFFGNIHLASTRQTAHWWGGPKYFPNY
jgi:hypothetical protein